MPKLSPSAQLILANQALALQIEHREQKAAELLVANIELSYQNEEKEKRAAELLVANIELSFQNQEKEKRAEELSGAYKELHKVGAQMKAHISGLEEMMFMTSHKVRKPVANILGLTQLLEDFISSPARLRKLVNYLRVSALELDDFTKELTAFISDMEKRGKGDAI